MAGRTLAVAITSISGVTLVVARSSANVKVRLARAMAPRRRVFRNLVEGGVDAPSLGQALKRSASREF
jgi:hypothetical protein